MLASLSLAALPLLAWPPFFLKLASLANEAAIRAVRANRANVLPADFADAVASANASR